MKTYPLTAERLRLRLRRCRTALALRRSRENELLREMLALSYSIAHDLRAPLRAMAGFARILEEEHRAALSAEGRDCADRIASAAAHMQRMIDDLLSYSRLTCEALRCRALEAAPAVEAALRELSSAATRAGAEVDVQGPFPKVLAHEATLGRVFRNLLENAFRFVAEGVRPRVRIRAEARAQDVRFWVEDNGIGVPSEQHGRIFGIFERLQAGGPGTGMGLAIVQLAMSRMKGRAGVESNTDGGSRFWIELRRAPGPPEPLPSRPV